jgi:hypothetical protein
MSERRTDIVVALQLKIAQLEERLDGTAKAVAIAAEQTAKAVAIAAEQTAKAVAIAAKDLEKWEKSANEWRGAINDERTTFVTRGELIAAMSVLVAIVSMALYFVKK